ncbi:MAG: hypothetical protein COV44_03855 [Deltaproteobacteria bacterium CG11_big_fil_rev_8_21_14_0_20_45_16]|nr:MAG: hypothetical protein COV44_03855 [Deltaproteobacteria bacterium CG11_big_fil_rev_8_21_14_0_20_45_16]PIS10116.1 MAG: SCO family protein [Bdellovibrio sp. CG10_big_fil_rev_8_21_14_0_10_47_8]
MRSLFAHILVILVLLMPAATLAGYKPAPLGTQQTPADPNSEEFQSIKIEEKLGQKLSINELIFNDENGVEQSLSSYFREDGKPVVMVMMYHACPSLCSLLLNGVTEAMRKIEWNLGDQYRLLAVSINPKETPQLALEKKANYIKEYGRLGASTENGWHFLTGTEPMIKKLTGELGFGYRYLPETEEYAHSAGFFVLTPDGEISRLFYGVQFEPQDLKLSLMEASRGALGSIADKVLLFCYRYDPSSKGYSLQAMRLVQAGGALTFLVFGIYLAVFWTRQWRGSRSARKNI